MAADKFESLMPKENLYPHAAYLLCTSHMDIPAPYMFSSHCSVLHERLRGGAKLRSSRVRPINSGFGHVQKEAKLPQERDRDRKAKG